MKGVRDTWTGERCDVFLQQLTAPPNHPCSWKRFPDANLNPLCRNSDPGHPAQAINSSLLSSLKELGSSHPILTQDGSKPSVHTWCAPKAQPRARWHKEQTEIVLQLFFNRLGRKFHLQGINVSEKQILSLLITSYLNSHKPGNHLTSINTMFEVQTSDMLMQVLVLQLGNPCLTVSSPLLGYRYKYCYRTPPFQWQS